MLRELSRFMAFLPRIPLTLHPGYGCYKVSAIKSGEVESFFAKEKGNTYTFPWTMFLPAITGKR